MDESFSWAPRRTGSPIASDEGEASSESVFTASEVSSASFDVERARDATHSAIALRTAPAGSESESTNGCQDVEHVPSDVDRKSSQDRALSSTEGPPCLAYAGHAGPGGCSLIPGERLLNR